MHNFSLLPFNYTSTTFMSVIPWGWKHTKGEPLFTNKKWCITSIIVCSKLKSWRYSLAIINTRKKPLKLAWQHFWNSSSFWVKINLDPMIRWSEWIKLIYIQYIIYNFSTAIRAHVCDSWNITKQKKIEKIMQCWFIKSPLWYGGGSFI
jgi:hypothetical protein